MADWTLVFHDEVKGSARLARFRDGRLIEEKMYEDVEQVEARVAVLSSRGLGSGIRLYSVPGSPRAEKLGRRLILG